MRNLSFLSNEQTINVYEKNYWKKQLKSNIKIGIEIESNFDGSTSSCKSELIRELTPTNNPYIFGKSGVNSVKTDGSLINGLEITTVGRKVNFLECYHQYKAITDIMFAHSPSMDSHAGLHNHILFDYGNSHNNSETSFNSIVFKNFLQLVKRHYPEIVWLTSTVKVTNSTEEDVVTRNSRFCDQKNLFQTAIGSKTIQQICSSINGGTRYAAVNANPMRTNENDIERMHIELRFPDGSIYPAQMASQNVLYLALFLKAVDLSEIGIINCGTGEDWEETKRLSESIRNEGVNERGNRCSTPVTEEQKERIKERALDMLLFLKNSICSIEPKCFPILKLLAEKPISIMRREMSDIEINDFFHDIIKNNFKDNTDKDILKLIATQSITGCNSVENWCYKASENLGVKYKDLTGKVELMKSLRNIYFDYELGAVIEE